MVYTLTISITIIFEIKFRFRFQFTWHDTFFTLTKTEWGSDWRWDTFTTGNTNSIVWAQEITIETWINDSSSEYVRYLGWGHLPSEAKASEPFNISYRIEFSRSENPKINIFFLVRTTSGDDVIATDKTSKTSTAV